MRSEKILVELGRLLLASGLALVLLVALELRWERIARDQAVTIGETIEPYYRWSFQDTDGAPVSGRVGPLALMMHPFTGYANAPNMSHPFLHTNRRGLRGGEISDPPTAARRVVVIGGSTAFGTGLANDSDALPQRLERELADTEVINASVIGFRSGQELMYLVSELVDLKPDLVVLVGGMNDVSGIEKSRFREGTSSAHRKIELQLRRLYKMHYAPFVERLTQLPRVLLPRTLTWLRVRGALAPENPATTPEIKSDGGPIRCRIAPSVVAGSRWQSMGGSTQTMRPSTSSLLCVCTCVT